MLTRKVMFLFCILLCLSLTICIFPVKATTLFSDGFESGDLSAWTGTTTTSGDTVTVESSNPHCGIYNVQFYCDGDVNEYASVYETLGSAQGLINTRKYFKFASLPSSNTDRFNLLVHSTGVEDSFVYVQVYNDAGSVKWRLVYRDGASVLTTLSSETISVDIWYSVELYTKVADGSDGECAIYVDGSSVCSASGIDTDNYGNVLTIRFGVWWKSYSTGITIYGDCAVIADAYIGPETAAPESVSLVLNTPANESTATAFQQNMNYTPTLLGLDKFYNSTLYVNNTAVAYNQTAIQNNTLNTITYTFPSNGTYLWDVLVWNSTTSIFSTNGNFTLTVAVYEPPPTPTPTPTPSGSYTTDEVLAICIALIVVFFGVTVGLIYSRKNSDRE